MNETELKQLLTKLHSNLNILKEREAKYGGNVPLDLLNQIEDHKTAITLIKSRLCGKISIKELEEGLAPLNLSVDRGGTVITTIYNLFNLRWQWITGVLLLVGIIWATVTYGPNLYHWYIDKATDDEVLILLADFQDESENVTYDAAGSIEAALREALTHYNLPEVRLVWINQTFKPNEVEAVKSLGKQYNATLFIWGYYDDGGMFPRFTILQEERLEVVPEEPTDKLVNLASPPNDFTLYVNRDLPTQMKYLTEFTIGQIFFFKGSFSEALILFEDAAELAETMETNAFRRSLAVTYFYKGYIYYAAQGDYDRAIADYNKAIELDPQYALPYINRGVAYVEQDNYKQALADYTKAIELNQEPFSWPYNNRGNVYRSQGDYDRAITDYNKAIGLDPQNAAAYINRGGIYAEQSDYKAITDYNKAIELAPEFVDLYIMRGNFYSDHRDPAQAFRDFNKAIEVAPNYPISYIHRGNFYKNYGDPSQAILDYTKAIELDSNLTEPYLQRGYAHKETEKLELAIADFERYLELASDASNRGKVLKLIEQLKAELNQ